MQPLFDVIAVSALLNSEVAKAPVRLRRGVVVIR
jgi:hypothetical protein